MKKQFYAVGQEAGPGHRKSPMFQKLVLVPCFLVVIVTAVTFAGVGVTAKGELWKSWENTAFFKVFKSHFGQELHIPLSQDTVYHYAPDTPQRGSRWKRNVDSSGSGDSSGDPSGETTSGSGDTTTAETTTADTTMSGDGETTSSAEGSAEATTASVADEVTTHSMFDISGSGDETTTSISATTNSLFDMSGDTTTDMSGDTTTDMSGDTTTTEDVTVTTEDVTATTGISSDNSTDASDETSTADDTTDMTSGEDATTAAVAVADGAGAGGDEGATVPLAVAIGMLIGGIVLGILLVILVQFLIKKWKARNAVTPQPTPNGSTSNLLDPTQPEQNWLMAREDTLQKAMVLGQIGVLEFALSESRSAGLMQSNPNLMKEAETKLNTWKRTRTQLETSYREKDLDSMDEFMDRFNESGMKDDTGVHQRCVDLKWNMKHAEVNMVNATSAKDEAMLMSAIGQYEALQLQPTTMAANVPYQDAKKAMDSLRQEKLLEGRSWEVIRADLRASVLARDPVAIRTTLDAFVKAEVPDTFNDVENAKRTLEIIEAEKAHNLEAAQKKLEDASISRDQDALREAIEECKKHGSSEEDLRSSEKLLRVVEKEDQLLGELRELAKTDDTSKLATAITVFKTPTLDMVDKTGDLKNAEDVLEKLKQKEKSRKARDDVLWRLQSARAVGDVAAMEAMISALEGLAATGEEIDEAQLMRAKSELEAHRGQVDYRKRMEGIKNALARTIAAENIPQTQDLIDQMSVLAEDKEFTMTADDSRVLDESRTALHSMKEKQAVIDEIATVKPDLSLSLIPPNLVPLQNAVQRMSVAKTQAEPFPGVFTEEDAVLLEDAKVNAKVLDQKVVTMNAARQQLDIAVEKRDYPQLKTAIREAITAPFIERKELVEPRKLAVFLDPKARRMAVKKAIRARDIRAIEVALRDLKDAKVDDPELVAKGERTVEKLNKREKRRAKQERRKQRVDAERAAEIAHLSGVLQQAIASRDPEHLQLALEEFEDSAYEPEDVPEAAKAEELFDELMIEDIRERLTDSINRRDLNGLEKAIDDADFGGYVMDVKGEYDIAKDLLYHLRELNRLQEAISEMSRSMISEIHKYPMPPAPVHEVMTAVFVLLGESPSKMKNWTEVQALLGKLGQNSISRRVRHCVPGDIPTAAVKKAEQQISRLKLDELQEISKGAATFYAWSTCMIKEHAQLSATQKAFADLEPLPDIPGLPERPPTRPGGFAWIENDK